MISSILGIADGWVALVFLLCLGSALLCVVYSALNWNRGDDSVSTADVKWEKEEVEVEKHLTD